MPRPDEHPAIAILGLGNELLMDDGVGVHAVRELRKNPPENVVVAEVGTAALKAQHLLEEADLVVAIDAVAAAGHPGSVYRFEASDAVADWGATLHELGLLGVLRLMPEDSRPEVIVVGIEPERIDYGMELTARVRAALPRALDEVRRIIEEARTRGFETPLPRVGGDLA